jgi:hypothetical protein
LEPKPARAEAPTSAFFIGGNKMTKKEVQAYYDEAKAEYEKALKVQVSIEARYLRENGFVNEDESVPGSIAEIRNRKLREIAFQDFWKNRQTMETSKFNGLKNGFEYAERKLNESVACQGI